MNRRKAAIIQSVGGYSITLIALLQGLILIPFYLNFITLDTFGKWLSIHSLLFIASIVNVGVENVLTPRVAKANAKNNAMGPVYFYAGLITYLLVSILFSVASLFLYIGAAFLYGEGYSPELKTGFIIGFIAMVISFFSDGIKGYMLASLSPVFPVLSTLTGKLAGLLSVVFLFKSGFGVVSIPMSLLIGEAITFFLSLIGLIKGQFITKIIVPNKKFVLLLIYSCAPLFYGRAGNIMFAKSYPAIISSFSGSEVASIYTVFIKAAELLVQLIRQLLSSISASYSHLLNAYKDRERSFLISESLLFGGMIFSAIGFSCFVALDKIFVSIWIGEISALSDLTILFIGIAFFLFVVFEIYRRMLYSAGKVVYVSKVLFLGSLTAVLIQLALGSVFGPIVVPGSFMLVAVPMIYFANKNYRAYVLKENNPNFSRNRVIIFCLFAFVFCFQVAEINYSTSSWYDFLLVALVSLSGAAVLAYVGTKPYVSNLVDFFKGKI